MKNETRTLREYTAGSYCANFHIHRFEAPEVVSGLHRHDFFQIILLETGEAKQFVDFTEYSMYPRSASVIFPHQLHQMVATDDAKGWIVMFDATVFCTEMLRNELKDYNINLQQKINHLSFATHPEVFDKLIDWVAQIGELCVALNPVRKMQVKLTIKQMLLTIIDCHPDTHTEGHSDSETSLYIRFREEVDAHFMEQRKVNAYAEKLGVTVKKLTLVCRSYTGLSPLEIIHERLSLELKKVLATEQLSFKEIAYEYGFSSQSALNKFVEQKFGLSPLALQQELKKSILGKK